MRWYEPEDRLYGYGDNFVAPPGTVAIPLGSGGDDNANLRPIPDEYGPAAPTPEQRAVMKPEADWRFALGVSVALAAGLFWLFRK